MMAASDATANKITHTVQECSSFSEVSPTCKGICTLVHADYSYMVWLGS